MHTSILEADMTALGEKRPPQHKKRSWLPQILKEHNRGRAAILCTGIKASLRANVSENQRKQKPQIMDCQAKCN